MTFGLNAELSVVIPSSKPLFLENTLKSLKKQNTEFQFSVIVVENPRYTETTEQLCKKYNALHLVFHESGANKARNAGIKATSSKLIAVIDDDVELKDDWVNRIYLVSKLYPNFGILGGKVELESPSGMPTWIQGRFRMYYSEVDWGDGLIELKSENHHFVAANMVFRREVWNKQGGFDERVGYSGDEITGNDELEFQRIASTLGSPGMLYDGKLIAKHLIRPNKLNLNWFKRRFRGQGQADGQYFAKVSNGKYINDIYHDVIKWQVDNFMDNPEEIRSKINNEAIYREYIKNYIICKTEYIHGLIEGLEC